MNRKAPLFVLSALLLTGCGAHTTQVNDESEKLMTIGDTTYTKGDEYTMVKKAMGRRWSSSRHSRSFMKRKFRRRTR